MQGQQQPPQPPPQQPPQHPPQPPHILISEKIQGPKEKVERKYIFRKYIYILTQITGFSRKYFNVFCTEDFLRNTIKE